MNKSRQIARFELAVRAWRSGCRCRTSPDGSPRPAPRPSLFSTNSKYEARKRAVRQFARGGGVAPPRSATVGAAGLKFPLPSTTPLGVRAARIWRGSDQKLTSLTFLSSRWMPRPCAVVGHVCRYRSLVSFILGCHALCRGSLRRDPKAHHGRRLQAPQREPPRHKAVASRRFNSPRVAPSVTNHGTRPWHPHSPCRKIGGRKMNSVLADYYPHAPAEPRADTRDCKKVVQAGGGRRKQALLGSTFPDH